MICNDTTYNYLKLSIVDYLMFEIFFSFLWKVIKLVGLFIRFPFADKQYSLEQLSNQNLSGVIGIIVISTLITLVFLLAK